MRDILDPITKWWEADETFGLATVVQTFSSAPREPGAAMAVSADGEVVGSVSGGCVEGAVYELAAEVTATGQPVLRRYGITDDDAFAVGLTCGGIIDIFVEPASRDRFAELEQVGEAVRHGIPVAIATVIEGPGEIGARRVIWEGERAAGPVGAGERLDQAVDDDARGLLAQGLTRVRRHGPGGDPRRRELPISVPPVAPGPRTR